MSELSATNGQAGKNVFDVVRRILVESLGTSEDAIVPDATLVNDLGAESIDFLDIAFRLEDEMGVKMPMREWAKAAEKEHKLTAEQLMQRLSRVFQIRVSAAEAARILDEGLEPFFPVLEERFGYRLTSQELGRLRAAVDQHLTVKEFAARQIEFFTVQSLVNFVTASLTNASVQNDDRLEAVS